MARIFGITVADVTDIFDMQSLFPELVLGLGLALLLGNAFAWWKHRRGEAPAGVEEASYRRGRVIFLMLVGVVMTVWGAVTLFA